MKKRLVRICYFGDSITFGLGDDRAVSTRERWTALVDQRLQDQLRKREIFIYSKNAGVNGETTRMALERLPEVLAFRPDIVTVQFGMNDCNCWLSDHGLPRVNRMSFKYNLLEIIDKCVAAGVSRVVLSTNYLIPAKKMMLNGCDYNDSNRAYNSLVREVAAEKGAVLCDIEKAFSQASRKRAYFLDEHGRWVHLSKKGNAYYAQKIFPFLETLVKGVIK